MEKVRVVIQFHRTTHYPTVIFLDDFDTPTERFILTSCMPFMDTVIEAQNWPDNFPMNCHLMHDIDLMGRMGQGYEWAEKLEEQWRPKPEPDEFGLPDKIFKADGLPDGEYEMDVVGEVIEKDNRLWKIISIIIQDDSGNDSAGLATVKEVTNEKQETK